MPVQQLRHVEAVIRLRMRNPLPFAAPLSGNQVEIAMPIGWTVVEFANRYAELDRQILDEERGLTAVGCHLVRPSAVEQATLEITYVEAG